MSASAEPPRGARNLRLPALLVALLALLPSLGTLDAPWIAEDALLLAQAREDGAWADWFQSQGGMQIVRFWRPVVSASWALQEATTGIAPAPLRLFNLALHALASVLALGCAARLGAGRVGACLAGAWVASFPEQGGTSTWLAGRTDLLAAVFLLGSLQAALGARPRLSGPLAFLACASKEFGFLAPLWILVLAGVRGARGRELLERVAPSALAALVALVWRTLVLGGAGGYAGVDPTLTGVLAGLGRQLVGPSSYSWIALLVLGVGAGLTGRGKVRGFAAAFALAGGALVLLAPLLANGPLEAENRRLLYVPECALALAAGFACGPVNGARRARWVPAGLALLVALRFVLAWQDTHDWAGSARFGEEQVARARAAVAAAEPGARPVLFEGFPASRAGAYCLGFGLAARFRAPFPESPRPVWPWRLLFLEQPARLRAALVAPRAEGSLWPLDDARLVPDLLVRADGGEHATRLVLDERVLLAAEDRSPGLRVEGGPPGAQLEAVLVTEHGYEPVPLGALDGAGAQRLSLMHLLSTGNGVATAGAVLLQAADLGAVRAYLELRALAQDGTVRAASPWIELVWSPAFAARALSPADS